MKRHKKHADLQLYRVLTDCMEIAEVCLRDIREYEVLDRLIARLPMAEGQQMPEEQVERRRQGGERRFVHPLHQRGEDREVPTREMPV